MSDMLPDYISAFLHYSLESRYQLDWNLLIQHSLHTFFLLKYSVNFGTLELHHIDKKALQKIDRKSGIQIMVCLEPA